VFLCCSFFLWGVLNLSDFYLSGTSSPSQNPFFVCPDVQFARPFVMVWIHLVPARSGISGLLRWCLPFDFSHRHRLLHEEFTDQFSLACFPLLACFLHQSAGPCADDL
jgi:hypothetical protein